MYLEKEVYQIETSLKVFLEKYQHAGFTQIGKSTIANINKIEKIVPDINMRMQLIMMNGETLILVAVLQYVILVVLLVLTLWIMGFYVEMDLQGYKDMFWSVAIPYVIGAVVYYISLYIEVKKANKLLQDIKGQR